MENGYYAVINFFCALLLGFLLYTLIDDKGIKKDYKKYAICSMSTLLVLLISDGFGSLVSAGILKSGRISNAIFQYGYFIGLGLCSYFAYTLLECINESRLFKNKKYRIIMSIPAIIIMITATVGFLLTLFNSDTHFVYYIDNDGVYHRAFFNIIQNICGYFYLLFILVQGLIGMIRKTNYARRKTYFTMIVFAIVITVGCTLQVFFLSYPFVACGITFGTIIIYVHLVREQVLTDNLTGIDNRDSLYNFLQTKMKDHNDSLYLIMLDLDKFKEINDKYGHIEGDNALILFSNALKKYQKETNCFISRYAGDEFIIVIECIDDKIDYYIELLLKIIKDLSDESQNPFHISTSYGYSKYDDSFHNSQEFINDADKKMYQMKKERGKR